MNEDQDQRTRAFEVPHPRLSDEYPHMPDGATEWERQEINRAWRECCSTAADACARLESAFIDAEWDHLPTRSTGNIAQRVEQFGMARAELCARLEGVGHRLGRERVAESDG